MLIRGGPFRLDFHDTSEYLIIVLVETGLAHPGISESEVALLIRNDDRFADCQL
ncbi:hypothetical protein BN1708_015881 [Verticillium longisporum]|uniref:Uncharacterized protein n=1 Tax=Verticillium longisporum TaxID=100787 RepID=A0A0G4M9G9_VERLO|nr:hypothetical protein BN1708_015881 [Verticillium longisporum]